MNLVAFEWIAWRVFVTGACAAMFVRLQCGATPIEPPTSIEVAFSHLVTPDELAAHQTKLLATVGEKSTRCARPVLRGEPAVGAALQDQLLLDAKDSSAGACLEDWRKTLDQPFSDTPTTMQREVIGRCAGPLEAAVRAAIGHAEGCSAYGPGGPAPRADGTVLFAGQLLGWRARELANTDPPKALWILLELMRLGQDHARGRSDLTLAMVGTVVQSTAVDHANAMLDRVKPANLDELAAALDLLLASEPSFGEAAAADPLRVAIDWGLAALEPGSWIPPGGKRSPQAPPADVNDLPAYGRAVQVVIFGTVSPTKIAHACPGDASLAACFNGLSRPVAVVDNDGSPRSIVQQALVETTIPLVLFTLRDYVVKRAQHHSDLIALRLRVEVMRHGCDRAALSKLAATPALGDTLQLDYTPDAVTARPPAWVSSTEPLTRRIACK